MAWKMNWHSKHGFTVSDAYVTVQGIKGKERHGGVVIVVSAYASKEDKDAGKGCFDMCSVTIPMNDARYSQYFDESIVDDEGKTDTRQAYAYTSTLDGSSTYQATQVSEEGNEEIVEVSVLQGLDFTQAVAV